MRKDNNVYEPSTNDSVDKLQSILAVQFEPFALSGASLFCIRI